MTPNTILAAFLGLALVAATADDVSAESKTQFCSSYTTSAVNQQRQNRQQNCGLTGNRWHTNRSTHHTWCMFNDRSRARSERGARERALERCQAGHREISKSSFCRRYAALAANMQREADRLGCGFRGSRWHTHRPTHHAWCMTNSRSKARSEERIRQVEVRGCRAGQPSQEKNQFCNRYADRALEQHRENRRLICDLSGERWHNVRSTHRTWCLISSRAEVRSHERGRDNSLAHCRAEVKRQQGAQ